MRNLGLVMTILLVAGLATRAQQAAGAQQASGQSSIQGCVMGSETTSTYLLTDEHTREIYLLHGNDPMLKEQVGHEVIMTGIAAPIRPSDKKGSIGFISPDEPQRSATSANAGQKALSFQVTHIRPIANRCEQQSESQKAAMAASQAALGSVISNNPNATEPKIGSSVRVPNGPPSGPTAPARQTPEPVGGETGNRGTAFPVTTTASAGQVTPGVETQAGKAQRPGEQTGLAAGGSPQRQTQAAPGAPLTAEQTAQNPAAAERIASSAERAEINTSQHQLGVNALPNYSQNAQQQAAQANQPVTRPNYEQNRNPQNGTELPGASQHIKSGQSEQQQAEEHQKTHPTLVGCVVSSGKSQFFLTEQKSGTRYRLEASPEELKDHVNHLVEVVGRPARAEGGAKAVAGQNEPAFEVSGIQDLAPTCGTVR